MLDRHVVRGGPATSTCLATRSPWSCSEPAGAAGARRRGWWSGPAHLPHQRRPARAGGAELAAGSGRRSVRRRAI